MGDQRGRLLTVVVLTCLVLVAAGCGRSGFQYIENDDSTVFAKIPEEWELLSEGVVDFTLVDEDGNISLLPGDETLPWRATFDAAPEAGDSLTLDRIFGVVEVQPVDRRLRSEISIPSLLGFDPEAAAGTLVPTSNGTEVLVLAHAEVTQGDLTGTRVIYEAAIGDETATIDRQILTDDRNTAVYELRLFCTRDCFDANAKVIDEIMQTFTVEVG